MVLFQAKMKHGKENFCAQETRNVSQSSESTGKSVSEADNL